MAKKKSGTGTASATKGATKKAATKKSAAKAGATKKAGTKAAPKKAPVKLNERQTDLLKKVHGAGEAGYHGEKAEARTLEALRERKLVKRGAKDKVKGTHPYTASKAGTKHLGGPATGGGPTP